jgi:hypothetical protein
VLSNARPGSFEGWRCRGLAGRCAGRPGRERRQRRPRQRSTHSNGQSTPALHEAPPVPLMKTKLAPAQARTAAARRGPAPGETASKGQRSARSARLRLASGSAAGLHAASAWLREVIEAKDAQLAAKDATTSGPVGFHHQSSDQRVKGRRRASPGKPARVPWPGSPPWSTRTPWSASSARCSAKRSS